MAGLKDSAGSSASPWKSNKVLIAGVVLIVVIFAAAWFSGGLAGLGGPGGQFINTGNCADSDSDDSLTLKGYVQPDVSGNPDLKVWDYCSKTREVGEQYCSNAGGTWTNAVKFVPCGSGNYCKNGACVPIPTPDQVVVR